MNREQRRQMRSERRVLQSDVQYLNIRHGINPTAKKVVMEFSRPISNTVSSPEEAVGIAKALLEGAQLLEPTVVQGFLWPGKKDITQAISANPESS